MKDLNDVTENVYIEMFPAEKVRISNEGLFQKDGFYARKVSFVRVAVHVDAGQTYLHRLQSICIVPRDGTRKVAELSENTDCQIYQKRRNFMVTNI